MDKLLYLEERLLEVYRSSTDMQTRRKVEREHGRVLRESYRVYKEVEKSIFAKLRSICESLYAFLTTSSPMPADYRLFGLCVVHTYVEKTLNCTFFPLFFATVLEVISRQLYEKVKSLVGDRKLVIGACLRYGDKYWVDALLRLSDETRLSLVLGLDARCMLEYRDTVHYLERTLMKLDVDDPLHIWFFKKV